MEMYGEKANTKTVGRPDQEEEEAPIQSERVAQRPPDLSESDTDYDKRVRRAKRVLHSLLTPVIDLLAILYVLKRLANPRRKG